MEVGTSVYFRSTERKTEEQKTGHSRVHSQNSGVPRGVSLPQLGKACVVNFLTGSDSGTRDYTSCFASDGIGSVYTQVEWQPYFNHWQSQRKADWQPGNKANMSIDD